MFFRSFLALPIILSLNGCAIHAPLSESLLFADDKPSGSFAAGLGISYTITPANWNDIMVAADRRYIGAPRVNPVNLRQKGVAVHPMWYLADRTMALSISLGTPVGLDVTLKAPRSIYLTAVGSFLGGYEGIAQRAILQTKYVGASVGVAYRLDHHAFHINATSETYSTPDIFSTSSVGIRLHGQIFRRSDTSLFLKSTFYVGHSPSLESGVVRFSLTTGVF